MQIPHPLNGTYMIFTSVNIVGTWDDEEVLTLNTSTICDTESLDKICEILRESAHKFGVGLDLKVTTVSKDW
jgi:hypothetical protein